MERIAQTGAPFSPRTRAAVNGAVRKLSMLPDNSPRKRRSPGSDGIAKSDNATRFRYLVEDTLGAGRARHELLEEACPVHFMKRENGKDRVWVDIAPYYKSKNRSFPLTAGVMFKCKVKDLHLSRGAEAELKSIKARLS